MLVDRSLYSAPHSISSTLHASYVIGGGISRRSGSSIPNESLRVKSKLQIATRVTVPEVPQHVPGPPAARPPGIFQMHSATSSRTSDAPPGSRTRTGCTTATCPREDDTHQQAARALAATNDPPHSRAPAGAFRREPAPRHPEERPSIRPTIGHCRTGAEWAAHRCASGRLTRPASPHHVGQVMHHHS